jgi:hypothetical protein
MRTQAHHTAEHHSALLLLAFIVAAVAGIGWALFTGASQLADVADCQARQGTVDECPSILP